MTPPLLSRFDLHLHTQWSFDGSASVEQVFATVDALGLACIAITEHHHLLSTPEALAIARNYPHLRFITAVEFTVQTSFGAVDLLCYGLPNLLSGDLAAIVERNLARQRQTGFALTEAMQAEGIPYTEADRLAVLRRYKPEGVIDVTGVTHTVDREELPYFLEKGWIASAEEYRELRKRVSKSIQRPPWESAESVARTVHQLGGVISLAHPILYCEGASRARLDTLREECQLDAIECAHPRVPSEITPLYRAYCVEHGLASTAGSDSHTPAHYEALLGRHGGAKEWLAEFLERLPPL